MRLTVTLSATVCAGALAATAGASPRLPTVLASDGAGYLVRPGSIYDTGDGSGVIGVLRPSHSGERGPGRGSLRWTRWTSAGATGRGSYWIKLGTPAATSPFTRTEVSVALTRVRAGHFTRMGLRYRQHGRRAHVTLCVPDRERVAQWRTLVGGRCL